MSTGDTLPGMPREIRLRLWIAAGIGGVLLLVMFAWRLERADTPGRVLDVDVCSLLRPQTVATLVPGAGAPDRGVETTTTATAVRACAYSGPRSSIDVFVATFGRQDGRSPVSRAHASAIFATCLNCERVRSVPLIGDETWEFSFADDGINVYARLGATVVGATFHSAYATVQSRREAARTVLQEVIAACGSVC